MTSFLAGQSADRPDHQSHLVWLATVKATSTCLPHQPTLNSSLCSARSNGFEGQLDIAKIENSRNEETGLQVYSLYGETRRPTAEMLENIDTLVFDIQDIGARFYTYISKWAKR